MHTWLIKEAHWKIEGLNPDNPANEVEISQEQYAVLADTIRTEGGFITYNGETLVVQPPEPVQEMDYAGKRAMEYPHIGDQLDALFHAGLFPAEMAAQIQAVKDKYPKE